MASSSHVSNVTVNVTLQALATPGAGFGTVTLMVDEDLGNTLGPVGTVRYLDFADVDEAQAARDSALITAEVMAACTTAFTLDPAPSKFRVCRVDTAGTTEAETYSEAYAKLLDEEDVQGDLYGFCMDSRTGATQEPFGETIEATDHFLYLQMSDADAITAGFPAAQADMEDYEQVGGCYHDDNDEWQDVAAMVQWLTPDPDLYSNPGEGDLAGVGDYATFLTATQRTEAIENNIGVLGTWGSTDTWLHPMVNFDGRPVYENLTAAWLKARIEERIQTLIQREHQANRKVLVSAAGQRQVGASFRDVLATGENVGHFTPGQVVVTYPTITDADRTARRLRVDVEAQVGISAVTFTFEAYLATTEVVS